MDQLSYLPLRSLEGKTKEVVESLIGQFVLAFVDVVEF